MIEHAVRPFKLPELVIQYQYNNEMSTPVYMYNTSQASKSSWKSSVEYIMKKAFYSLELIINFMADPKINFPYPV